MKKIIIPIVCLVLGVGGGVGAGLALIPKPDPEEAENMEETSAENEIENSEDEGEETAIVSGVEYIDLANQFIVPLLVDGRVDALVILSMGLEIVEGSMQEVYMVETKIRAAFLQSLFNHANNGGFTGNFTAFSSMEALKRELLQVAKSIAGASVTDVLILDLARQ